MTWLNKIHPRTWKWGMTLSLIALCISFVIGVTRAGKNIKRTCMLAGQPYDENYRSQNWQEPAQLFPLHNKCNANYDLIPPWINPALVIFAFLALACLTMIVVSLVQKAKARRAESPDNENS